MERSVSVESLLTASAELIVARRGISDNLQVTSLAVDSRCVTPGALFFGVQGALENGSRFLEDAASRGAVAAIVDDARALSHSPLPIIQVSNARLACARAAAEFYAQPSRELMAIGVTGTNGKTSVAWILAGALERLKPGPGVGYVGTLGLRFSRCSEMTSESELMLEKPSSNTTPGPLELQPFLSEIKQLGGSAVCVEASSWGIAQHRVDVVDWDCAIFTNLTRDHLDVHETFEDYGNAKAVLFEEQLRKSYKSAKIAVINVDDRFGLELERRVRGLGITVNRFSVQPNVEAEGRVKSVHLRQDGTDIVFEVFGADLRVQSRLVGSYNVSNMLAAALALCGLGFPAPDVAEALSRVSPVPGRLELVARAPVSVFVDYAHTPDGLVVAQSSLRKLTSGKLITVFGCGGDRDRGKRPLMGEAVARGSDYAVVTSDNPRSENPDNIISDILPGLVGAESHCEFEAISDRRQAIRAAISIAGPGDVVLVAGKGHEDYQEIQGSRLPFSDVEESRKVLSECGLLT